jgi:hypothetical protein
VKLFCAFFALVVTVGLTGCLSATSETMDAYEKTDLNHINDDLAQLFFGDMHGLTVGTLQTNAVPLKLGLTAVLLQRRAHGEKLPLNVKSFRPIFESWGFLYADLPPETWDPSSPFPRHPFLPVGVTAGELLGGKSHGRIEILNFSCSGCHSGTGYDASGHASLRIVPGLPNTSLKLDQYMDALFSALKQFVTDDAFRAKVDEAMPLIFPQMTEREIATLKIGFPLLKKTILAYDQKWSAFAPTRFGGAGLSNAVGLFKSRFKTKTFKTRDSSEAAYVSIPILFGKGMRSALLVDGSTAPQGAAFDHPIRRDEVTDESLKRLAESASYFPMLVTGASLKGSLSETSHIEGILAHFTRVAPPHFPGKIDGELAARGRTIFDQRCTGCHGTYSSGPFPTLESYPNKLVPLAKIGTDALRSERLDDTLVTALAASELRKVMQVRQSGGYVAPMLTAVWATAPYLHNGSVPTLYALMHPAERPITFSVGGHDLDFNRVGIDSSPGARHWTPSTIYDTREVGRGNSGHEFPFKGLAETEKTALLEFLKTL